MPSIHHSSLKGGRALPGETGDPVLAGFPTRRETTSSAFVRCRADAPRRLVDGPRGRPSRAGDVASHRGSARGPVRARGRARGRARRELLGARCGNRRASSRSARRSTRILGDIRYIQSYIVERAERAGGSGDREFQHRANDRCRDGACALWRGAARRRRGCRRSLSSRRRASRWSSATRASASSTRGRRSVRLSRRRGGWAGAIRRAPRRPPCQAWGTPSRGCRCPDGS